MNHLSPHWLSRALPALLALALLAGCGGPVSPTAVETTSSAAVPTASPVESSTAQPAEPTATTGPAYSVVLWAPAGTEPALLQAVTGVAQEYADDGGLGLSVVENLRAEDLSASVPIVISLASEAETLALAQNGPEITYVGYGTETPEKPAGLALIPPNNEHSAFIAGAIAALVTPDWRVGAVVLESQDGLAEGFLNGARYYCGVCAPKYPPYEKYPLVQRAANAQGGPAAVAALKAAGVTTVFLPPELLAPETVQAATDAQMLVVGGSAAGAALAGQRWVAAVDLDPAAFLRSWLFAEGLQAGTVVTPTPAPLEEGAPLVRGTVRIAQANPAFLNAARLRPIELILAALAEGQITPLSVPLAE